MIHHCIIVIAYRNCAAHSGLVRNVGVHTNRSMVVRIVNTLVHPDNMEIETKVSD